MSSDEATPVATEAPEAAAPAAAAAAGAAEGGDAAAAARPMSASLYVGDLDPEVGESLLFDIFKQVGPVASIRVCRDNITRRSLGYAYVNFHNVTDADRALDMLNYSLIKGRPCRIMWSHRDPSIRRSGVGNVFIKNLDAGIDNKSLFDTFSTFGNILSCKVEVDEMGNSKGYGYVHYETQEAADLAIEKVNGMLLNDTQVYVGTFIPKKDRTSVNPGDTFTNVYVKNFDESWSEEKLMEVSSQFGEVDSAIVMKDGEGKSRCFGFVNFKEHESAKKAVEGFSDVKCGEKTIFADRAQKKSEREAMLREKFKRLKEERMTKYQGVNLYIKNLDDSVDEDKLREEFEQFGTITSVKIMMDERGVSRGFGFVCFSKPDEAAAALAERNGYMIANKPIYVAMAQAKEVRRAQLEASHSQRQQVRMQQPGMAIPGQPMYPHGPQMFYPPGGMQQGRPLMYPQQVMRRFPAGAAGGRGQPYPPMPGYVMPQSQRGQRQGRGGGRGGAAAAGQPQQANGRQAGGRRGAGRQGRGGAAIPMGAVPMGLPITDALDAATLAQASPEMRKQMLGDSLFPLIQKKADPAIAAKITGMILESTEDSGELLHLIEDSNALSEKVNEAVQILKDHQESTAAGAVEADSQ